MPSRKTKDGSYKDVVHPINSEFRKKLEDAALEEYRLAEDRLENDNSQP